MSRSRRKTKIFGNCGGSDKLDKIRSSKKMRRLLKVHYNNMDAVTPDKKDFSNIWEFNKDGKSYWRNATKKDMTK